MRNWGDNCGGKVEKGKPQRKMRGDEEENSKLCDERRGIC